MPVGDAMKRRAVCAFVVLSAALALCVDVSGAQTRTERGHLVGTGDSNSFTITSPGPKINVAFSCPRTTVDFWVSVTDKSGGTSRFDLDKWESVPIIGAGVFTLTVYSASGAGDWTATYVTDQPPTGGTGVGPGPPTPFLATAPSDSGDVTIHGQLSGPGDVHTLKIPTQSSYLEVVFSYPKDAMSLSVRVVADDKRTVLGVFDLDKGEIIELYGGGIFYLTVFSTRGHGKFTAKFNPTGSPIPQSYVIATGVLKETTDEAQFPFEAPTEGISIYFDCPAKESDLWVKVTAEDGKTILGDFDLSDQKIVDLKEKGKYLITVYSRGGAGSFTAFYFGGPPAETASLGVEPPEGGEPPAPLKPKFPPFPDESKLPRGSILEKGSLSGTGDFKTFIVNAKDDYVEVSFSYPKGAVDFWVRVIGEDGIEVMGDFDLDNGEVIQLVGGGTFYLKVYSKDGAGDWSAVFNEGIGGPAGAPNGISSRPRYTY
jgi:hypothetical protein